MNGAFRLMKGSALRTLSVLVVLSLVASACSELEVTPTISCALKAENPHESSGTPGVILGKVRYGCNAPVTVDGRVVLQKKNSAGAWVDITNKTYFNRTVSPNRTYTAYSPSISCRTGVFRTYAYAYGYTGSGNDFAYSWSQTVVNPCG